MPLYKFHYKTEIGCDFQKNIFGLFVSPKMFSLSKRESLSNIFLYLFKSRQEAIQKK